MLDAAGGVYVAGYLDRATTALVRQYDANGNETWSRQFGRAGEAIGVAGIAIDANSVYLAGASRGSLPNLQSPGPFIRKYDLQGNELWTWQFGTLNVDLLYGIATDVTGVYVVGRNVPPGPGIGSAVLRKFNAAGNELWIRQIANSLTNDVAANSTGIYVTGTTAGALPGQTNGGSNDAFVRKYDSSGYEMWTRQFGGNTYDVMSAIALDNETVYVAGDYLSPSGSARFGLLVKIAPSGSLSTKPVITSVVNGASFASEGVVQSNSWVTLRGTNLASTTRVWEPRDFVDGRLPTSLDGVTVTINNQPAAVYYISPSQLNVLAPTDTALGMVSVMVTRGGEPSEPFPISLVAALPGLFTFSPQNGRYAAATLADGSYLGPPGLFGTALTTVQAKPDDVVILYGTGCGPTNPPVPADRVFSGSAQLTNPVRATIGGVTATVQYAGMTGVGLCQFNLVVPDVADGDQAVAITLGNLLPVSAFIPVRR